MRNYFLVSMRAAKKKVLLALFSLILLFGASSNTYAEDYLTIGTGTATSNIALGYAFYYSTVCEYLLTQAEIQAAGGDQGIITSLGIYLASLGSFAVSSNSYTIWMMNAPASDVSIVTHAPTAMTQVLYYNNWQGWSSFNGVVGGWTQITLNTPFEYTGGALYLRFCMNRSIYSPYVNHVVVGRNGLANRGRYLYSDNGSFCTTIPTNEESFIPNFRLGIEMGPTLISAAPKDTIFGASATSGAIVTPEIKFKRKSTDPPIFLQYICYSNDGSIAWQGRQASAPANDWIAVPTSVYNNGGLPITWTFDRATGFLANNEIVPSRMSFRSDNVKGGKYKSYANLRYTNAAGQLKQAEIVDSFEVRYNFDLTVGPVVSPESFVNKGTVYPLTDRVMKFSNKFINSGLNDIAAIDVTYRIRRSDNSVAWGFDTLVSFGTPLKKDQEFLLELNKFNPADPSIVPELLPGGYTIEVEAHLASGVFEPYSADNISTGDFWMDYPYDGQMNEIKFPTQYGTLCYGVPYYVKISVSNLSVFDARAVEVTCEIGNWRSVESIDIIPGGGDMVIYEFKRPFIPTPLSNGMEIKCYISDQNDNNKDNNGIIYLRAPAVDGLSGAYTVGSAGYFKTIDEAVDALYSHGTAVRSGTTISCADSVIFRLLDGSYNIGSNTANYALDFSTSVPPYGNNTTKVKFVPSEELSYSKGSVVINMKSKTGLGIRFASAISNSSSINAPINKLQRSSGTLPGERMNDWVELNIPIVFDGGNNKSIQFKMDNSTAGTNRVPLYVADGAKNVTFKNCIITGTQLSSTALPSSYYDITKGQFCFNPIEGVSAGVLLSNRMVSGYTDTIMIHDIVVDACIVENGNYGIVSTGIGPLYDVWEGAFKPFNNHNNTITNNSINSQRIAGIFFGYESNSSIRNNNIFVIGMGASNNIDNAGIILGGYGEKTTKNPPYVGKMGYNNTNINIEGNEISKIYTNNSNTDVYGIKIEQELNNFLFYDIPGNMLVPNNNDSISLINNVIWGLYTNTGNTSSSRFGIRLFASRQYDHTTAFEDFTVRRDTNIVLNYCKVFNNTIVIEDDKKNNDVNSYIAGLVLQDVKNFKAYNNAIAVLDTLNLGDVVAPLVLQSIRPSATNKIEMDNNLYYAKENVVVRFIEQDSRLVSNLLNAGSRKQFLGLEQWSYLTEQETETSINNFYNDLYTTKTNPQKLQIKDPAPTGSYLNNRGKNLAEVLTDINGNMRGMNDQVYDIGAYEFQGDIFDNDLSVLTFTSPVAARDYDNPQFQEAEYVMTTAPVDVKVNIRNNGGVYTEADVKLDVYRRDDATGELLPVKTYTKRAAVASLEKILVDFDISNQSTRDFPKTYAELKEENPLFEIPVRWQTMAQNVSPVYHFVVTLPYDQDISNNVNLTSKDARYYINKSKLGAIISADSTDLVPMGYTGDVYQYIDNNVAYNSNLFKKIVGFLNFNAIRKGLSGLGYSYSVDGYDVFDRSKWEPNSVNYSAYRYLFWADGYGDMFSNTQEGELTKFLADATGGRKKSIIVSAEEIARNSAEYYEGRVDLDYMYNLFGLIPRGTGIYDLVYEIVDGDTTDKALITGSSLYKDAVTNVENTPLIYTNPPKDSKMQPGFFEYFGNKTTPSAQAFYYTKRVANSKADKTMGMIAYTPAYNAIYLGIDWKNYSDPSVILASILNYIGGLQLEPDNTKLAMSLLNFDAYVLNDKVSVDWEVSSEVNISRYEVERSNINDANFEKVDEIVATGSNALSNTYKTIDANVLPNNTYNYRLKVVELDGAYTYSAEKQVSIEAGSGFVSLEKPIPNPAMNNINVSFTLSEEENVHLAIYDITGCEVAVISDGIFSGKTHNINFSIANLPSGSYNVVLTTAKTILTQRLNIVK